MATDDIATKQCSACCITKGEGEFNKKCKGLQPRCRDCQKAYQAAYRAANVELCKQRNRDWYKKNSVPLLASLRANYAQSGDEMRRARREKYASSKEVRDKIYAWRSANPQSRRESSRRYYETNSTAIRTRAATWRKVNPLKSALNGKKWALKNADAHREIMRSGSARRRARKSAASGSFSRLDIRRIKLLQKSMCACCRNPLPTNFHVDHVMPLARGGSNDSLNLQLLCPKCNLRKSAKHPIDFMQELGFLI